MREYHATIGLPPEAAEDDPVLYYHDLPDDLAAEAKADWQGQSIRR